MKSIPKHDGNVNAFIAFRDTLISRELGEGERVVLSVGERLRELRKQRDLSQEALGQALTMPQSSISNYELGVRQIDADELPKFAAVLNCHPCDFFEARPAVPVPAAFERAFVPGGTHDYTTEQLMIRETLKIHMQLDDEEADELIRLAGMFQRRRKQGA